MGFSLMELFLDFIRSLLVSRSLSPPFANRLSQLIRLPILGHLALAMLLVLFGCPTTLLTPTTRPPLIFSAASMPDSSLWVFQSFI